MWITFNLKLRPTMAEALSEEAEELGVSRAALIRMVLQEHLNSRAIQRT